MYGSLRATGKPAIVLPAAGKPALDTLRYGVAYYYEYMPYERLEKDVQLMKKAGINVVRVAESTWSKMEPKDGVFDFSRLDRVLDVMSRAGIRVIVGTPTYAFPPWLAKDHPAVIGYQADNETKHYNTAGDSVQAMFKNYLISTFKTADSLNAAFGLAYWSNSIHDWGDLPSTIGNVNASLGTELAKFQRGLVTDYLGWQVGIINEYKRPDQFVTHNFDFEWRGWSYGIQPEVDHFEASRPFDRVGADIYHPGADRLTGKKIQSREPLSLGPWELMVAEENQASVR